MLFFYRQSSAEIFWLVCFKNLNLLIETRNFWYFLFRIVQRCLLALGWKAHFCRLRSIYGRRTFCLVSALSCEKLSKWDGPSMGSKDFAVHILVFWNSGNYRIITMLKRPFLSNVKFSLADVLRLYRFLSCWKTYEQEGITELVVS